MKALLKEDKTHSSCIFNMMAADGLMISGARASANIDLAVLEYSAFSTRRVEICVFQTSTNLYIV